MSSCVVGWTGRCPDPEVRARLVGHMRRLAEMSETYLMGASPERGSMRGRRKPRANIEYVSQAITGEILISSGVAKNHRIFAAATREADLPAIEHPKIGSASMTMLKDARLSGIDFSLFAPNRANAGAHRLSFVFLETGAAPFLNGRLVQVDRGEEGPAYDAATIRQGNIYLGAPEIELHSYLEDWIDLLLSWVKYFFVGDLCWRHIEEMQGYEDYRKVFSDVHRTLGTERAEKATFDAILATFAQHADHWSGKFAAASGDR